MKLNMKKAFTLVEMLIVIVIIGILAAALIPRLTGVQSRARDVARKADISQLSTALTTYQLDNGTYVITGGASIVGSGYALVPEQNQLTAANNFAASSNRTVNGSLGVLVHLGLLKTLPVEGNTLTQPYVYNYYASGEIFSLMALSEGGWVNANFASGAGFNAITNIIQVQNINNKLCTSVSDATTFSYSTGGACTAPLTNKIGRYILAN